MTLSHVPRVLAVIPRLMPSTTIGIVKPLLALHEAGDVVADVRLEFWVPQRAIAQADVVIFARTMEPRHAGVLARTIASGKPIIYELDDNLFALSVSGDAEAMEAWPRKLEQLERYIRAASLVRVYSTEFAQDLRRLNADVRRVDAMVDWRLVPTTPPPRDPGVVRLVYATSRIDDDIVATTFTDPVGKVLGKYGRRVELVCCGHLPQAWAGSSNVHFRPYEQDYDRFFEQFTSAGYDIGLAPLADSAFFRAKSNNKFREYAAARAAGVYSDVVVYAECVEQERTGVLVPPSGDAWFAALCRLVDDAALRTRIQTEAYRVVRARHTIENAQRVLLEQIRDVLTRPAASGACVALASQPLADVTPTLTHAGAAWRRLLKLPLPQMWGRLRLYAGTMKRLATLRRSLRRIRRTQRRSSL